MKTVFTTSGLHARDRFAYWHDVAERVLTGHDSRPARRDHFNAELRAAELADIGLFSFAFDGMDCERGSKHIANGGTEDFFLCRNGSGQFALEQTGRRNVFEPGDLVLLDSNMRYSVRFTDDSEMLMLKIPRRILEARFGTMREVLGAKLPAQTGVNGFLSGALLSLKDNADGLDVATMETIRNQLVDLCTHAFGTLLGDGKRLSAPRSLAVMRLRSVIEARLADPSLDSDSAARAAGVTTRYGNSLLEAEGTTIARLIRETRLERCRMTLSDPGQDHRTISEIAFAWGFSDLTNFGRLFSATFGMSPREFRRNRTEPLEAPPPLLGAAD